MRLHLNVLTAFAVFALPCVFAQTTGVIRGTVTDPSGAVIGGAKVTAILQGTNTNRTTSSDSRGEYVLPTLAVGKYTIEIEAPGFKKYVNRDLDVTIGHVIVADASLELGEVSQVITAEAKAALVETSSTQLGAVVNETTVTNLPLNERDTYQLLQLQPGVQSQQGYDLFAGSEKAGVVSVNGGRGRSNNFNVNGGDGNDQFIGVPAIQPSPDTIQEFRVLTNTFDAEFGRNSGAVVNVVTKGGTNNFHGNLFEFFRNRALNTRGFFDSEKPDFKQNQFGGTFGGPIKKDKTFFFGSYEERHVVQGISSDLVTVPTVAERTGDFSAGTTFAGTLSTDYMAGVLNARPGCAGAVAAAGGAPIAAGTAYSSIFPNNKIPTPCFDQTAFDLLNQFVPVANRGDSQYQSVPGQRDRDHQGTLRIDHVINDHQQLNFYYYADDDSLAKPFARFQAAGANIPGFGSNYDQRIQQWNIGHTWVLGASAVNEFRFAYFREGQLGFNHPQNTSLVQNSCKTVPADQCFSDPANPKLGITPGLGASH
ncbi:MAG TPA: carboxypeptidase regulatory-like domain-containing protein, partial [Bryobacteraceae bacterium]|nr:carboxypeptidase regulatory-like domain-containing protein [Bryobacteraceae bacterium]